MGKRNPFTYDPLFKMDGGTLTDVTALESKVGKVVKTIMYGTFAVYGFFMLSILVISDNVEINSSFVAAFMSIDMVKTIYMIVRIISVLSGIVMLICIFRRNKKYEITQIEGMNLLRAISFNCIMASIVVIDFYLIFLDPVNAWVIRFWKGGNLIFEASAIIDVAFLLPVTIMTLIILFAQIMKMKKQTGAEIMYHHPKSQMNENVIVDTRVMRLRCTETKKGRICKIVGKLESNEFR